MHTRLTFAIARTRQKLRNLLGLVLLIQTVLHSNPIELLLVKGMRVGLGDVGRDGPASRLVRLPIGELMIAAAVEGGFALLASVWGGLLADCALVIGGGSGGG